MQKYPSEYFSAKYKYTKNLRTIRTEKTAFLQYISNGFSFFPTNKKKIMSKCHINSRHKSSDIVTFCSSPSYEGVD